MAGRNRNTFLKRQKEVDRVRKAREKMARRHGKKFGESGQPGEPEVSVSEDAGAIPEAALAPEAENDGELRA